MNTNLLASLSIPHMVMDTYGEGDDINVEPAVRYVLRHLERLGAEPVFSCEGHDPAPATEDDDGCVGHRAWYVYVVAPAKLAEKIAKAWPLISEVRRQTRDDREFPLWFVPPSHRKVTLRLTGRSITEAQKFALLSMACDVLDVAFGVAPAPSSTLATVVGDVLKALAA